MRITRKMMAGGLASVTAVAGLFAGPLSVTTNAMSLSDIKEPQKQLKLKSQSGSDVDVTTQVDCSTHMLEAKVTNKTDQTIHPDVTFNKQEPTTPIHSPIDPGKSANYYYTYSGNNFQVNVDVSGDTIGSVESTPTINCMEPVSFKVTDQSSSTVVGTLSNNSTLVPQTVYTQVTGNSDVHVENLQPGESRTISIPFRGYEGQTMAIVKIATSAGYESNYTADLDKVSIPELPAPLSH